ncbi:MAG: hypothetical protein Tsb002_27170 [Wenzhouxiangellaceae bacterium]
MNRHSIIVRLNPADKNKLQISEKKSIVSELRFVDGDKRIGHGIGQMLEQLAHRSIYPSETAIDLALLAATVTAADTRISRAANSQDSWTREIDIYIPVANPELWRTNTSLIVRTLSFLTGDVWRLTFRARHKGMGNLISHKNELETAPFDSICLFSGGLDSYTGAIDLLSDKKNPLFVSHYKDASTKNQVACATQLGAIYGDLAPRHVRANVSFDKNDLPELSSETTTRGRSFIFFALAALAASGLRGETPIYVPENGLISLNVPLDPLRLGAWSTRTTHPYYMARWQDLIEALGIGAHFLNPYRFKTKGEMLTDCKNRKLLRNSLNETISCSSITKGRWKKLAPMHCGYCTPCLIRRASIIAGFGKDSTEYSIADLYARPLDGRQAEATDVRAFQMMSRRIQGNPSLADILVHKTGPLSDYSIDEIKQYAGIFRRGIKEVGTVVDNIKIETP